MSIFSAQTTIGKALGEARADAKARAEVDFKRRRLRVGIDPDGPGELPTLWSPWVRFSTIERWGRNVRDEVQRLLKRARKRKR